MPSFVWPDFSLNSVNRADNQIASHYVKNEAC